MPIIPANTYYAEVKSLIKKTFAMYTHNNKFYTIRQGLNLWKKLRAQAAAFDASALAKAKVDECFCKIIREYSENRSAGANTVFLKKLIHDFTCCVGTDATETVLYTLVPDTPCTEMTCIEDGIEFNVATFGDFTSLSEFVIAINAYMAANYPSYVPNSATLSDDCTKVSLEFDSTSHPASADFRVTITPQGIAPTISGGTCPLNFTAGVRFNGTTYNSALTLAAAVKNYLEASSYTVCACTFTTGTCVFNITSPQIVDIPLLLTQL